MAPIFRIIKLPTVSPTVRDEYVQRATAIAEYSLNSEPGTTKYAVCVPRSEEDKTTLWIIEEYTDQSAFDAHLASSAVKDINTWRTSQEVLAEPPKIIGSRYILNDDQTKAPCIFTKPSVTSLKDPYITFARIEFQPGKRDAALPAWKAVLEETKGESGSYVYGLVVDDNDGHEDVLYTMQVYESERYLREVHLKENKAVEGSKASLGMSVGVEHSVLRLVGGYLSR